MGANFIEKILDPEEVWDYIQNHSGELLFERKKIAEDGKNGIIIYIGMPRPGVISAEVEMEEVLITAETIYTEVDCYISIGRLYELYLESEEEDAFDMLDDLIGSALGSDDAEIDEEEEIEFIIEEREEELDTAIYDFVYAAVGPNSKFDLDVNCDILDDLKEFFLEYMARKYAIPVYRPMYLEDENEELFFEEYPYECMDFEDEDNPLYASESDTF